MQFGRYAATGRKSVAPKAKLRAPVGSAQTSIILTLQDPIIDSQLSLALNKVQLVFDDTRFDSVSVPTDTLHSNESLYSPVVGYGSSYLDSGTPFGYRAEIGSDGVLRITCMATGLLGPDTITSIQQLTLSWDGKLIGYATPGGTETFNSGTSPATNCTLVMRDDGSLAVLNGAGTAIWSTTAFSGRKAAGYFSENQSYLANATSASAASSDFMLEFDYKSPGTNQATSLLTNDTRSVSGGFNKNSGLLNIYSTSSPYLVGRIYVGSIDTGIDAFYSAWQRIKLTWSIVDNTMRLFINNNLRWSYVGNLTAFSAANIYSYTTQHRIGHLRVVRDSTTLISEDFYTSLGVYTSAGSSPGMQYGLT